MELADVLDSKSSGSDTVRVRPPLPAPRRGKLRCTKIPWVKPKGFYVRSVAAPYRSKARLRSRSEKATVITIDFLAFA